MRTSAALMLLLLATGCSLDAASRGPFGPDDPETAVPKKPLPAQLPTRHVLEFSSDESPEHIKPKMAGSALDAGVSRSPNREAVLSAADIAGLRKVAETDPRVAALLGERWGDRKSVV